MKQLILAFVILFAAGKASALETRLINLLLDAREAYGWDCTGAACREVWKNQIRTLNRLTNFVDLNVFDETEISASIGKSAYSLADVICRTKATAPYQILHPLVTAENRALHRLATLQKKAKLKGIRDCEKIIR